MHDLVAAMWSLRSRVLLVLLSLCAFGCEPKEEAVLMPSAAPDEVVVSWGMIGRNAARDTLYMAVQGNRDMVVVTKSPNGTMMSVEQVVPEKKYRDLVRQLRALDCCSLESTHDKAPSALESKPELGINFGDLECQVSLWDSEWRTGRARACGSAVAAIHGRGFLPEDLDDADSP